jgi:hypothetical protein
MNRRTWLFFWGQPQTPWFRFAEGLCPGIVGLLLTRAKLLLEKEGMGSCGCFSGLRRS